MLLGDPMMMVEGIEKLDLLPKEVLGIVKMLVALITQSEEKFRALTNNAQELKNYVDQLSSYFLGPIIKNAKESIDVKYFS